MTWGYRRTKWVRPPGSVLNGYDLEPYAVMTQQEVADAMGLSRARIQQLEQAALHKLRRMLERHR